MNDLKEKGTNATEEMMNRPPVEGKWTKRIENQTAKVPSVFYLSLGIASMVFSAGLRIFAGRRTSPNFVGLWVPTFLLLGIYNKLVKLEGNDRMNRESAA